MPASLRMLDQKHILIYSYRQRQVPSWILNGKSLLCPSYPSPIAGQSGPSSAFLWRGRVCFAQTLPSFLEKRRFSFLRLSSKDRKSIYDKISPQSIILPGTGTDRLTTRGGALFGNSIEVETLNDQLWKTQKRESRKRINGIRKSVFHDTHM